jgi:hypothetical protein
MRATIEGRILGLEAWDFEGKTGHTLEVLQRNGRNEIARLQVPNEYDLSSVPPENAPARCEVDIRTGFGGKGFKLRLVSVVKP